MEALKDLWASLVSGIRDRTTNPLTVAFIVSWSVWNYKLFIVLLGDEKTSEKLDAIASLYPDDFSNFGETLWFPLGSAFVYVYIYPLVGFTAIWAYRKYQVWTTNAVKEIEKTRILSRHEADELTRRHEKERKKWEVESVALNNELTSIRLALHEAEQENEKLKLGQVETVLKTPESKEATQSSKDEAFILPTQQKALVGSLNQDNISDSELKLIAFLSKLTEPHTAQYIAKWMQANFTLIEVDLNSLHSLGFVQKSPRTPYEWSLTSKGKQMAVSILKTFPNLAI